MSSGLASGEEGDFQSEAGRSLTRGMAIGRAPSSLILQEGSLLRGTRVAHVLRRHAQILCDRPGTAEDYELSRAVDHIDAFISHNWATPRGEKFLALALHFNLVPAVLVATAAALIAFMLTTARWLPLIPQDYSSDIRNVGIWCQLSGTAAFLATLFSWHEFGAYIGYKGPVVFLDKICVHQTDADLKRKGIRSLAALLSLSWNMVVLYSETYLQKLWTVYEIATFLMIYPQGRLHVQPTFFPKVVLCGVLMVVWMRLVFTVYWMPCVQAPLHRAAWKHIAYLLVWSVMLVPPLLGLTRILGRWEEEQAEIHRRIRTFSISDASCLSDEDRVVVEANIASFAVHFGCVAPGAAKAEALSAFDAHVRHEIPLKLASSLGHVGMPYRHAALIFGVHWLRMLDVFAGLVCDGRATARNLGVRLLLAVAVCLVVGPGIIALCSSLTRCAVRLQGVLTWAASITVVTIAFVAYISVLMIGTHSLVRCANSSNAALATFAGLDAAGLLCTLFVYRRPRMSAVQRRLEGHWDDSQSDMASTSGGEEGSITSASSSELSAVVTYGRRGGA